MSLEIRSYVIKQLILSRLILVVAQFIFNYFIPDLPTDAFDSAPSAPSLFNNFSSFKLVVITDDWTAINKLTNAVFDGLARWDGRHFLHVAEHGYSRESALAFFPLWPTTLRTIGAGLGALLPSLSSRNAMILAGVLLNNVSSLLYRIFYKSQCRFRRFSW